MTEEKWQQRLAAMVEQVKRRREQRAEQRAQLAERRAHGLRVRHAQRLNRAQRHGSQGGSR